MLRQRATTVTAMAPLLVLALSACTSSDEQEAPEPVAKAAEPMPSPEPVAPATPPTPPAIPAGAKVMFIEPTAKEFKGPLVDGKIVVPVKMGAEGIAVEPAGEQKAGSGHHHILIDSPGIPTGTVVPKDETHLHFGKGQTEAQVPLPPGKHSLTLQFADGLHLSYGPELSASIGLMLVPEDDEPAAP